MLFSFFPLSSVARAFLSSACVALLFFGRSVPLFGCVGVFPLFLCCSCCPFFCLLPLLPLLFLSCLVAPHLSHVSTAASGSQRWHHLPNFCGLVHCSLPGGLRSCLARWLPAWPCNSPTPRWTLDVRGTEGRVGHLWAFTCFLNLVAALGLGEGVGHFWAFASPPGLAASS